MPYSSWLLIFTIVFSSLLTISALLNWYKPRTAFTWMFSLITSVYYAPLWLFSLFLTILIALSQKDLNSIIPSLVCFIMMSLVFLNKLKNSPLLFSEIKWSRLFFPRFIPLRPTQQLNFPTSQGSQKIDYFSSSDPQSKIAVFFLFGGGFLNNNQSQLSLFNKRLSEHGIHIFALNYRQLPQFPWPTPLEDILAMIDWTLKNLPPSVSIDQFFVGGRSAGGCLSLMSSAQIKDSRFKGVFAFYPVTDLVAWANEKYSNLTLKSRWRVNLLCKNDDKLASQISPVNLNYPKDKKFLVLSGDFDPLVDIEESLSLQKVFSKQSIKNELKIFKTESHGFDASFDSLVGQKIEKLLIQFVQS